jgi:hypothetical protein
LIPFENVLIINPGCFKLPGLIPGHAIIVINEYGKDDGCNEQKKSRDLYAPAIMFISVQQVFAKLG